MDAYKVTAELKLLLEDYGVVFPYDPYGAINLEETIAQFLEKYFDQVADYSFDQGVDEGYDTGYSNGYSDANDD